MEFKVRALDIIEPKSVQEVEKELPKLKKINLKLVQLINKYSARDERTKRQAKK